MKETKTAELKANLSAYLATVRRGETVIVYDRSTPIARIVPYVELDDFTIIEAVDPPSEALKITGVKPLKPIDVLEELRLSRGDH